MIKSIFFFTLLMSARLALAGICTGDGVGFEYAYQNAAFVGKMTILKRTYAAKGNEPSLYSVKLSEDYRYGGEQLFRNNLAPKPEARPEKIIFEGVYDVGNYRNVPEGSEHDVVIVYFDKKPPESGAWRFTVRRSGDHCGVERLFKAGSLANFGKSEGSLVPNKPSKIEFATQPSRALHNGFLQAIAPLPQGTPEEKITEHQAKAEEAAIKSYLAAVANLNIGIIGAHPAYPSAPLRPKLVRQSPEYLAAEALGNAAYTISIDNIPKGYTLLNTPFVQFTNHSNGSMHASFYMHAGGIQLIPLELVKTP